MIAGSACLLCLPVSVLLVAMLLVLSVSIRLVLYGGSAGGIVSLSSLLLLIASSLRSLLLVFVLQSSQS